MESVFIVPIVCFVLAAFCAWIGMSLKNEKLPGSPDKMADDILEEVSPNQGVFRSIFQRPAMVARTNTREVAAEEAESIRDIYGQRSATLAAKADYEIAQINEPLRVEIAEMNAPAVLELAQEKAAHEITKLRQDHVKEFAQHRNEVGVLEAATAENQTPETYGILSLKEGEAMLEVKKHREMEKINLETWEQKKRVDLIGGIISRLPWTVENDILRRRAFKLIDDMDKLKASDESAFAKRQKLSIYRQEIKQLKEAISDPGKRPVQSDSWEDVERLDDDLPDSAD